MHDQYMRKVILCSFVFLFLFCSSFYWQFQRPECKGITFQGHYQTYIYGQLDCLEKRSYFFKARHIRNLKQEVLGHLNEATEIHDLIDGSKALTQLYRIQLGKGDLDEAQVYLAQIRQFMDKGNIPSFERAYVLLPVASYLLEYNHLEELKIVLAEIIELLPKIPAYTDSSDQARYSVLDSILDLQKRAGFYEWANKTEKNFVN